MERAYDVFVPAQPGVHDGEGGLGRQRVRSGVAELLVEEAEPRLETRYLDLGTAGQGVDGEVS